MLPVALIGLGPLGRKVATDLLRRKLGRVVAAIDSDERLVGKDLSEVVSVAPSGTIVRSVPGEVEDWTGVRCAIVTTRSDLELCIDTFRDLLTRGCNVISTCEELSWPWLRHPILAQELHELAVRHRARILGTGINPGFLMDALPVALSTACHTVARVRIERIQDASSRRIPFQRKIGVGLDEAAFAERVSEGVLRHVGLGESLHFVAHYLGKKLDRWEESIEPVFAERALESGLGPVAAGQARGVRQVGRGYVGDDAVIEMVFHAALDEPNPVDRVVIEGEPPLEMEIKNGVHGDVATSAVLLNSIRPLIVAEPGLHTMASLPLQGSARTLG